MAPPRELTEEEQEELAQALAAQAEADRTARRFLTAEHTGAWATFGYVVLSLLGLLHEAMVLRRFGINFAEYAQVSDFLVAAIRDPFVVAASVVPGVLIFVFYQRLGQWSLKRDPAKFLEGRRKAPRLTHPLLMAALQILVGVTWATSFQMLYANVVSGRIRRGEGAKVAISVSNAGNPERPFPSDSALVITVTSGYVFAYYPTNFETRVIPVGNLAYLGRRRVPPRKPKLAPGWGGANAAPPAGSPAER